MQLQKSLFLLGMEVPAVRENFYEFFAHNYGPFCKDIYADAERLAQNSLIVVERTQQSHAMFLITAIGEARVAHIKPEVPPRTWEYLRTAVEWTQQQSFSGLIRAIYDKYPEYRVNSVFQY
ncbi:MAG: hypothetical protein WBC78_08960 [Candidatus Sulfotelmatobacter sp.]